MGQFAFKEDENNQDKYREKEHTRAKAIKRGCALEQTLELCRCCKNLPPNIKKGKEYVRTLKMVND